MKPLISGNSTMSLQEQLNLYAERVVHDRHSIDVLEAFLQQMEVLFNKIYRVLYAEANIAASIAEQKPVGNTESVMQEHISIESQLSKNLNDFLAFIKKIVDLAKDDDKFLKRNKKLIASLIARSDEKEMFVKSAETGIENEEQYIDALEYLDSLKKNAGQLLKHFEKIKHMLEEALEKNSVSEKNIAMIETARFSAESILKNINEIENHLPGLRELDADSARTLGMLSQIM